MPRAANEKTQSLVLSDLTDLEFRILRGVTNGESVKSLAATLSAPRNVVERSKIALMKKLSAESTADLVRITLMARVRWP